MNPKLKRNLMIALRIPIFVCIATYVVILMFYLAEPWRTVFAVTLFAVIVIAVSWYAIYFSKKSKRIEKLLDILYKEANPEKFIAESEKVLEKTKVRAIRNTLLLNLAVGYEAAGKFNEAIRIMKEMDISSADKVSQAMYYANAASFFAENGAAEEASEAYMMGRPYFEKAAKDLPAAHLQLSRGLCYYAEEKYEDAQDAFEKARGKGFDDRHTMTKTQLFEARALAHLGKTKEAKAVYHKVLQKKTYPYLLECAKAELAKLETHAE